MADELPLTLRDFEAAAEGLLEPGSFGYFAGGAGDEITLRDNVAAWGRWAIRPRMLVGATNRDPSCVVLGQQLAHPIVVAPTAYHRLATAEGEAATARAAAATDSVLCLSSLATATPTEIAAAAPDVARWFQLYVWKDRGLVREVVAEAREAGYTALVVTVDAPVFGARERDKRTGFQIGPEVPLPNIRRAGGGDVVTMGMLGALLDQKLGWGDIEAFAADCGLPVVVKGLLTPEDALLAAAHGAAGVVVSNHGGRQLDTTLSGADALGPVVDAVGDRIDVLVDGGIRRGWDVVKALALGAKAVMVGRPVIWGLATGGEDGARRVLDLLLAELDHALLLAGCPRAADLDRTWVQPAPWAGPHD